MQPARIYTESWEVDQRLAAFGVTRAELRRVVQAVVAARAEAVQDDPVAAAGQFAYIFGTRHLRALFKPKKWIAHSEQNVESVKHPTHNLKIVYQSVDIASSDLHAPRAVSAKGAASDRMISAAQGSLFSREQLDGLNSRAFAPVNSGVWFFCVSVDGDDVRAELSLPAAIEGGNFRDFIERIFVVQSGDWDATRVAPLADDAVEFEPVVTRRK